MTKRLSFCVALAATLALCLLALPQVARAEDQDKSKSVSDSDKSFVNEAAMGGRMEVRLGKLAQKNAENDDVKKFGEMMVTDHTAANKELMKIAKDKGIDVPKQADSKHTEMADKLKDLKGAEFDKAYMAMMIQDHQEDVEAFQKESENGADSEIKAFATKTLDTLKTHLARAKEVGAKVGATGNG